MIAFHMQSINANSLTQMDPAERVLREITIINQDSPLWPSFKLTSLWHLSQHLYAKYAQNKNFKTRTFEGNDDIQSFLNQHSDSLDYITDLDTMGIAFQSLALVPFAPPSPTPWIPTPWPWNRYEEDRVTLLAYCGGIRDQQVKTNFKMLNYFYEGLITAPQQHGPMGPAQPVASLFAKIMNSKFFNVNQKQLYSIEQGIEVLDTYIPEYFNTLHQLLRFEWEEWEEKAPRIQQYLTQYQFVIHTLDAKDGDFYSGLSIAPYSVSLVRTAKAEKAETPEDLKKFAEEHHEAHQDELKEYEHIQPHFSTLKKAVKWFDDLFEHLKKQGRVS